MRRIKDYQTLIAGVSLALSIIYAGSAVLALAFRAGEAVSQHEQIMKGQERSAQNQERMIQLIHETCK